MTRITPDLASFEVWFFTGSQNLYGDETLRQVAEQSQQIAAALQASTDIPVTVVWKPVLKDSESIKRAVLDANIRFAAGADNVRDPFNPVGRSDALETASLLVTAGHLTLDEAYTAVSDGARSVLALPEAGVKVGAAAELLALRGSSLADVIANASADRYVIHAGNLVAQSTVSYDVAEPALSLSTVSPESEVMLL